jgi:hypothetical protein
VTPLLPHEEDTTVCWTRGRMKRNSTKGTLLAISFSCMLLRALLKPEAATFIAFACNRKLLLLIGYYNCDNSMCEELEKGPESANKVTSSLLPQNDHAVQKLSRSSQPVQRRSQRPLSIFFGLPNSGGEKRLGAKSSHAPIRSIGPGCHSAQPWKNCSACS